MRNEWTERNRNIVIGGILFGALLVVLIVWGLFRDRPLQDMEVFFGVMRLRYGLAAWMVWGIIGLVIVFLAAAVKYLFSHR